MSNEQVLTWVKFVVGLILFSVMFYIDVFVKTVDIYLFAIPGILMEEAFKSFITKK